MSEDDILRAVVKGPVWDEGNRYGDACAWQAETEKGRFCYGVDLAGLFYMQTPEREHDGFPTLAAAQAAAEADYRARIATALDLDKLEALTAFIAEFADAKIEALPQPRPHRATPEDGPDPVVDAQDVWAFQEEARSVLAALRGAA